MDRLLEELRLSQPPLKLLDDLVLKIDDDPVADLNMQARYAEFGTVDSDEDSLSSEASLSTPKGDSSIRWFWERVKGIASNDEVHLDGDQLGAMVLSTLQDSTVSAENQQNSLVDMVGFDYLDFVSDVITHKDSLLRGVNHSVPASSRSTPGLTEDEVAEWKRKNRIEAAERAANLAMSTMIDPKYPHVYRRQQAPTALSLTNIKRVLPEGTTRESMPNYEHVAIPAQIPDTRFHPKHLIKVADLDELCRTTFSRYDALNKMQSLVYPVCYETSENMLICAPTGAGKTDVALLSILSTIKGASDGTEPWKIVYVAPLKALAAEITDKLGSRLAWLGIKVRELTGDMQLTRAEIAATHVIVTTPEKWDVVTRKSNDDSGLATQLQLLIVDEVHLLHEERGAVIESIVARTRRQVEAQQRLIRIVGLSATLPNFIDVAEFLGVNPQRGLFFFDASFRPVPLEQQFFGVRAANNPMALGRALDNVAYEECVRQLRKGHSVMIFVHSRRDTTKTAEAFIQLAQQDGLSDLFKGPEADSFSREMQRFNSRGMQELFAAGFATHHAGMSRAERNLSEKLFANGGVKVLCSTATLAWGVNLPAAVVIIKGTQVYDAQRGGFVDLGISDVIQIFGRAGRPQFEQTGTGILCTSIDKLDHYLDAITNQNPIESRFSRRLSENLNAEVSLGTVSNINEAVQWLGYTYMHVRMRRAPQVYGLLPRDLSDDPALVLQRRKMAVEAAQLLRDTQMLVFDENDPMESLIAKDIGRIASEFYLLRSTVEQFNEKMGPHSSEQQVLKLLSAGADFEGLKVRKEETNDLEKAAKVIPFEVDLSSSGGKASTLFQAWILRISFSESALASDMAYVADNSGRIIRAFFLLCVSRGWAETSIVVLTLEKALKRRLWPGDHHPLVQLGEPPATVQRKLSNSNIKTEDLKAYSAHELGDLISNQGWGSRLKGMLLKFPVPLIYLAQARPLTSSVARIDLEVGLQAPFSWDSKVHGTSLYFWLFVHEDQPDSPLLHVERYIVNSRNYDETQRFEFAVPVVENMKQLVVRLENDSFIGSDAMATIDMSNLKLPLSRETIRTNLIRLRPLPVTAWQNPALETYYGAKFKFFNPMQTMVFHTLYHQKGPVLLGSPTGSGKTVASEMAVWAALRDRPEAKVVYIAPMKALVKERVHDWSKGLCTVPFLPGGRKPRLIELTGDTAPAQSDIQRANLIITTPEKFDGVSRHNSWAINNVSLVIMDEVHLLASDRGAILEMIVSRLNLFGKEIRLLGMSTAVANAGDLASWLGVKSNVGLFNFPSSVRPVPLEMYIDGFAEVQGGFCPLMKSMNKPAYLAIKRHAPSKPALVFVPSRRQTRMTAMDLISMCGTGDDDNPRRWLHMSESELAEKLENVKDDTLRHTLQFGVAIHHAGLEYSDRQLSHELFASGKVQVLVATSTLAWGVNLPAYLVIVKGTQFFDAKINKYRDMDLTDVLQMMGRAGRPAFDTSGVAVVFTKQSTKQFYKYFLNLGFPVESSLHKPHVLENHLGAEISSKRVISRDDALRYLKHTFLFHRIYANPSYYGVVAEAPQDDDFHSSLPEKEEEAPITRWLIERMNLVVSELQQSQCLSVTSTASSLFRPTAYLAIASFYYISHLTMRMFLSNLPESTNPRKVLQCLALASEYDELAIRHNEDILNTELSKNVMYPGEDLKLRMVDPHVKAYLLVQARMRRLELPIEDYIQDTVTVLDQAVRIMQAFIDTAAQTSLFGVVTVAIKVLRSIKQGVEPDDNMLGIVPGLTRTNMNRLKNKTLKNITPDDADRLKMSAHTKRKFLNALNSIKTITVSDDMKEASIEPTAEPVWCPMFHKPQRESWFVLVRDGARIVSLERVQRPKKIVAPSGMSVTIMSDTLAIDYELMG